MPFCISRCAVELLSAAVEVNVCDSRSVPEVLCAYCPHFRMIALRVCVIFSWKVREHRVYSLASATYAGSSNEASAQKQCIDLVMAA